MAELLIPLSERLGEAPALVDERGTTHWIDFNLRVNRLIAAFGGAGLRPEDTIAILSENRREYFECMTAATHCGLRYVPVNWHWVAEEVAYVLENADARALICGERFRPLAAEVVARDDCPPLAAAVAMGEEPLPGFLDYEQWLASASDAEPLASAMGGPMFYTSGTTGKPKGAELTHVNLFLNCAFVVPKIMPAGDFDKVALATLPLFHSFGQTVIQNGMLAAGGTFTLMPRFEPGAGGEYKQLRGFDPQPTRSAHFLRDPRLAQAVGQCNAVAARVEPLVFGLPFNLFWIVLVELSAFVVILGFYVYEHGRGGSA